MKILMVGNTRSGKSTYMYSSYGLLHEGKYGFFLRSDGDIDSSFLDLYQKICNGGYPVQTDKRNRYSFDLFYYQKKVLSFEWIDYYGGVVTESKSDQLQDDLDDADGIMVFFEASALLNNDKTTSELRRILYLVSNKIVNRSGLFNVMIVLTKYDMIPSDVSLSDVCSSLQQFKENVDAKDNIYFRIIPVSCTQKGFVNVDLPLLDILHSGLYIDYLNTGYEVQALYEKMNEYNNKRSIGDWIFSKILSVKTNGELATEAAKMCLERHELFKQLTPAIENLDSYVKQYQITIPNEQSRPNHKTTRKHSRFNNL